MGKFNGILICTDLDGTLFRKDKSISKKNTEAIEYFKGEGGYFTFITGRMPACTKEVYNTVKPNCPFGCINGGGIYDGEKNEYLYKTETDRRCLEIVRFVDKNMPEMGIQIDTFDNIYFSKDNDAMKLFRKLTGVPLITRHYDDVDEKIAKILFADINADNILYLSKLLSAHPLAEEFDFVRSEKSLYEIMPKGINKATALEKLKEFLSPKITITIGDYSNDVEMLKRATVGIAVGNASPDAKEAADFTTVTNEEDAIAEVILNLEKYIKGL